MGDREDDGESILEALDYDDDADVEMLDADDLPPVPPGDSEVAEGEDGTEPTIGIDDAVGDETEPQAGRAKPAGDAAEKKRKRKKKRRKNKSGGSPPDYSLTDINRFVVDTCRRLKEKKPYLVWNAVGCLGVAAISDLVKEVNAIQACGGQQTADGSRLRSGGGLLWNILKTRDSKAYKEIMTKGREFEKQFRSQKVRKVCKEDENHSPNIKVNVDKIDPPTDVLSNGAEMQLNPDSAKERKSALDRIRVPVAYDDLFEEGEII